MGDPHLGSYLPSRHSSTHFLGREGYTGPPSRPGPSYPGTYSEPRRDVEHRFRDTCVHTGVRSGTWGRSRVLDLRVLVSVFEYHFIHVLKTPRVYGLEF